MLLAFINKQDAFDNKNWFFCPFKWITDTKKLRKSKEMVIYQHSAFICNCAWELIKKIYLKIQCRSHIGQRVQCMRHYNTILCSSCACNIYLPRVCALMSNEILTFRTYIEHYSLYYKHYILKRLSDIKHIKIWMETTIEWSRFSA